MEGIMDCIAVIPTKWFICSREALTHLTPKVSPESHYNWYFSAALCVLSSVGFHLNFFVLVAETGEEPQPAALHVGILLSLMGGCC